MKQGVHGSVSNGPSASPLGDCAGELVHSGELNVKSQVGDRIPEFPNLPEEQTKVSSAVGRKHTGYVLPENPLRPQFFTKSDKCEGQRGSRSTALLHPAPPAGDRDVLAGRSAGEEVEASVIVDACFSICYHSVELVVEDFGHVAEIRNLGVVVREDAARELLDLREEDRLRVDALGLEREGLRLHARAHGRVGPNAASSVREVPAVDAPRDPCRAVHAP